MPKDTEALVSERAASYGHPLENFTTIAAFWTTWGHRRGWLPADKELNFEDVAHMNILQKEAREAFKHGDDNEDDVKGYIRAVERAREKYVAK